MKKNLFSLLFFSSTFILYGQKPPQAFDLVDVKLLNSPFKTAAETDKHYILSLDINRLLAPYLKEAGLPALATSYGNWENTGLDGHIGGHYLSALSLMYASTGDIQLKEKLDYMIDQLEKCQLKNGNGYLSGIPAGKPIWNQIRSGNIQASSFSLNGRWVPLYNLHKIFAGLYDAYSIARNQKAKKLLVSLTDWCLDLVADLSDKQIQTLLISEHGGLNEVFANVYQITGERKYLTLARKFSDLSILKPLLERRDVLNGLHANTQIPKVIGYEQIALVDRDTNWSNAAKFFWEAVVNHRTVSIGGNSVREHFHPANDFSSMVESREGPETCNSYNMLKLTKQLFLQNPASHYLDYYERTLYNHILTSQGKRGGFVYFTPMRPGHYRTYSNVQESFWCCVGTGMENHGKYGELIYAQTKDELYVNLFIPSILTWKDKGIKITQETSFPSSESTVLKLDMEEKKRFVLKVRCPSWIKSGKMAVTINGKNIRFKKLTNGYISIDREWKSQDLIKVSLPMHNTAEFLPDGSDWVSFLHGPIVLAAALDTLSQPNLFADGSRMGHIASGEVFPVAETPLVSGNKNNIADFLKRDKKSPLSFNLKDIVYQQRYNNLKLEPFYNLAEKRYIVYFPYSSIKDLPSRASAIRLQEFERTKIENATVDIVNNGEQQPETDHQFVGEKTTAGIFRNRHYRSAQKWFSYALKNPNLKGNKITLTYHGLEKNKKFTILINSLPIAKVNLTGDKGDTFYNCSYNIPPSLISETMEIKFHAENGFSTASIYELRLMK